MSADTGYNLREGSRILAERIAREHALDVAERLMRLPRLEGRDAQGSHAPRSREGAQGAGALRGGRAA